MVVRNFLLYEYLSPHNNIISGGKNNLIINVLKLGIYLWIHLKIRLQHHNTGDRKSVSKSGSTSNQKLSKRKQFSRTHFKAAEQSSEWKGLKRANRRR